MPNWARAVDCVRVAHSDLMYEELTATDVLDLIPEGAALVAPVITSQGTAVFVVPSGKASLSENEVLWLDKFTDRTLQTILAGQEQYGSAFVKGGWLKALSDPLRHIEPQADVFSRCTLIEETGQSLWNNLMGPVADRLRRYGVRDVLLIPQGGLSILPLHAAWRDMDGTRRYFLDDYTIAYVPSVYARRVGNVRLRDPLRHKRTLVAIVNPTNDLLFAPTEGHQIARLFGERATTLLSGSHATVAALKQARGSYLHFACHGIYSGDIDQSGLTLANGEQFTFARIVSELRLDPTRLVTLSACESGVSETHPSPDEHLGLPTAFLHAGAPAVVSSLWAVNDFSTMLLMERFYQSHLHEENGAAAALQQAQIWLRDVTAGELAKRFAGEEDAALAGEARMDLETASTCFDRFAAQDPSRKPFAHPYYWAAFTFTGA